MAYSELVKNFAKAREYMSQFFIYGFKSRNDYNVKSARSYDNERRRIESWLGEYMSFRQSAEGKNVFIALDSRSIQSNPLYKGFKAKSFTSKDITLHFIILDILYGNLALTAGEITEIISAEYCSKLDCQFEPDVSTVRKKLKEYDSLGILKTSKQSNKLLYSINTSQIDIARWNDAVSFFAEASPLGVVGSYILDKSENNADFFCFKHHYILHTLESEILYQLLNAITDERVVTLELFSVRIQKTTLKKVVPLKIRVSTQSGRRYLLCWSFSQKRMILLRLDSIKAVTIQEKAVDIQSLKESAKRFSKKLWGVSSGSGYHLDHIEMTVYVDDDEQFIVNRLEREKRNGEVIKIDDYHYKFVVDVYDAIEMLPWIRTFIGRIEKLTSDNSQLLKNFEDDIKAMQSMYGGSEDAV